MKGHYVVNIFLRNHMECVWITDKDLMKRQME